MNILFVCTGNICRSPMAEAFFNVLILNDKKLKEKGHFSKSAGIYANDGDVATQFSFDVLNKDYNISIKNHVARRLIKEHIKESDLILTMTVEHKNEVILNFSESKEKIFTLKEYANRNSENKSDNLDIADPYSYSRSVYNMCAKEIKENIDKIIEGL